MNYLVTMLCHADPQFVSVLCANVFMFTIQMVSKLMQLPRLSTQAGIFTAALKIRKQPLIPNLDINQFPGSLAKPSDFPKRGACKHVFSFCSAEERVERCRKINNMPETSSLLRLNTAVGKKITIISVDGALVIQCCVRYVAPFAVKCEFFTSLRREKACSLHCMGRFPQFQFLSFVTKQ